MAATPNRVACVPFGPRRRRIGAFPIGIQRVIPFTKGTAHPLQLDLQILIFKKRTKDSLGGLGELGEIALAVPLSKKVYTNY